MAVKYFSLESKTFFTLKENQGREMNLGSAQHCDAWWECFMLRLTPVRAWRSDYQWPLGVDWFWLVLQYTCDIRYCCCVLQQQHDLEESLYFVKQINRFEDFLPVIHTLFTLRGFLSPFWFPHYHCPLLGNESYFSVPAILDRVGLFFLVPLSQKVQPRPVECSAIHCLLLL